MIDTLADRIVFFTFLPCFEIKKLLKQTEPTFCIFKHIEKDTSKLDFNFNELIDQNLKCEVKIYNFCCFGPK